MLRVVNTRRPPARRRRRTRGRRGRGKVSRWLKKAVGDVNRFLRKHKVVSRLGDAGIGFVPEKYQPQARAGLMATKALGYGRRTRRKPRTYRLGYGLRLAGA